MPDEYQRAETAAQLAEFCNEACIDGPKVSEELAAKHLDEYNEGMAMLEREDRSCLDADWWFGDFINRITNWTPPRPLPCDAQLDLIDAISDSISGMIDRG